MKRVTLALMAASLLAMSGFAAAETEVDAEVESSTTPAASAQFIAATTPTVTAATKKPALPVSIINKSKANSF